MSNRQLAQAFQQFSREAQRLYRNLNRKLIDWLLRSAFVSTRRGQNPVAGFILPTTILLLLVVTLTVGAITLRAVDRNTQVIANTQQKVIYNAATPAIDRARAKIEFLFDPSRDTRYPGGVPQESSYLLPAMLNAETGSIPRLPAPDKDPVYKDVYTLPGENRLNIGGKDSGTILAANDDNAWWYRTDTNGDGQQDATVVYSILFQTPSDDTKPGEGGADPVKTVGSERLIKLTDAEKAKDLLVRNAPISNDAKLSGCSIDATGESSAIQDGWFPDKSSTSKIRKNFQVDAIVIPDNPKAAAVTIEFQQDRQLDKGNKWGAWFRNDLEIHAGDEFNWNGAMHTEGNLVIGGSKLKAFLISAKKSCLFQADSSEVSTTRVKGEEGGKDLNDLADDALADGKQFVGHVVMGKIGEVKDDGSAEFHYHNPADPQDVRFNGEVYKGSNDSIGASATYLSVLSDPVAILLNEKYQSRTPTQGGNQKVGTIDEWEKFRLLPVGNRITNTREKLPYVDDLYRADDRWGPKPKYDDEPGGRVPDGKFVGDPMKPDGERLRVLGVPGESSSGVGLDGYWERRARIDGMRILVGERLELGDIGGWETPRDVDDNGYITPPDKDGKPTLVTATAGSFIFDPTATPNVKPIAASAFKAEERAGDSLYPPTVKPYPVSPDKKTLDHRMQSRRTLRDNLPAVQSAAVYHAGITARQANNDVDYPVACLSMTSHPGNVHTLRNSVNFIPTFFAGGNLQANFFTGQGTNGWEFQPPSGDYAAFVAAMGNKTSPLRIALDNLANFAGDPDGAFPPKQEETKNLIHPYPALTMWGNYSNLRRALVNLDKPGAGGYAALSVADKTYLQTAACTVGMLAYNIDRVQAFDVTNPANDGEFGNTTSAFIMAELAEDLAQLMDGNVGNGEVLPKTKMATYRYGNGSQDDVGGVAPAAEEYKPSDYYEVSPEAYIAALKQKYAIEDKQDPLTNARVRLAEMIMLKHQIRRDRTFGFRSSPAFGEYAVNQMGGKPITPITYGGGASAELLVFPTACDPDLFVLRDGSIKGGRLLERVPFDASGDLKPMPTTPNSIVVNGNTIAQGAVIDRAAAADLTRYRLALSRLCGTIDATNYRDNTGNLLANAGLATFGTTSTNENAYDPKRKATVKPMFPALYYLFPEVEHSLKGAIKPGAIAAVPNNANVLVPQDAEIPDEPDAYDHRQPGTFGTTASEAERIAVKAGLHPKDKESYVTDAYVAEIATDKADLFRPVNPAAPVSTRYDLGTTIYLHKDNTTRNASSIASSSGIDLAKTLARRPYLGSVYPVADLSVSGVDIQPRALNDWQLPIIAPKDEKDDVSINTIFLPNGELTPNMRRDNGIVRAVPFLDRAIYDGRQDMMVRVTDVDLGMLRKTEPKTRDGYTSFQNLTTKTGKNEFWMPLSGIIYAFREDAVREDAIARPAKAIEAKVADLAIGTSMNQTDLANPYDSQVIKTSYGISLKPIDFLPDPDRRIHGFRLRNGSRIDREFPTSSTVDPADRGRGLSFFTDQPVYIQGDFNLHQNTAGDPLEEFKDTLPIVPAKQFMSNDSFYDRDNPNKEFALPKTDRWRPSEILADSIDILSGDFCDGSIADAFMPNRPIDNTIPATDYIAGFPDYNPTKDSQTDVVRTRYQNTTKAALYGGKGCTGNGFTSFQNQAGPDNPVPDKPEKDSWDWMRENSAMPVSPKLKQSWQDFTTPIRISRTGDALMINRPVANSINQPLAGGTLPDNKKQGDFRPVRYELDYDLKYLSRKQEKNKYSLMSAADTRVNSIVVGGIQPSREKQGYGGLQNFPRFLEDWGGKRLFYSGSFIQLNFSNYATAGYEKEGTEAISIAENTGNTIATGAIAGEEIPYYGVPTRVWGYDVALQFVPAGPAAARFVTPSSTRSEFYSEPPRTDPYVRQLCIAAKAEPKIQAAAPNNKFNCP